MGFLPQSLAIIRAASSSSSIKSNRMSAAFDDDYMTWPEIQQAVCLIGSNPLAAVNESSKIVQGVVSPDVTTSGAVRY